MPPKGQKFITVYGTESFLSDIKKAAALEPDELGNVGMPISKFSKLLIAEGLRKRYGTAKKPKLPAHLTKE